MPRFYTKDVDGHLEYRFAHEDIDQKLDQNNIAANVHRDPFYDGYDRVLIEDPRDNNWFAWYKGDFQDTPERQGKFEQMYRVAMAVGSVMLRDTPLQTVEEDYNRAHPVTTGRDWVEVDSWLDGR